MVMILSSCSSTGARYFSVYYSQLSERYHYSHLKVCLLQLQQVGMTMKGTSSSYSMYAYVLSQTGNDAELLVPELLKHVTDIQLEKYQVFQSQVYMFFVLHVLATLVASAIA